MTCPGAIFLGRHRLEVRTTGFHPVSRSSILRGARGGYWVLGIGYWVLGIGLGQGPIPNTQHLTPDGPRWRNWQTRMVEGHVGATLYEFKSRPRHQKKWMNHSRFIHFSLEESF